MREQPVAQEKRREMLAIGVRRPRLASNVFTNFFLRPALLRLSQLAVEACVSFLTNSPLRMRFELAAREEDES
jgi:hypothetical protein